MFKISNQTIGRLDCPCQSEYERKDNIRITQEFGTCSCGKDMCFYEYETKKQEEFGEVKSKAIEKLNEIEKKIKDLSDEKNC